MDNAEWANQSQMLARDIAVLVKERTAGKESFEDGMTALAQAVAIHLSYLVKDPIALAEGAEIFGRQVATLAIFYAQHVEPRASNDG